MKGEPHSGPREGFVSSKKFKEIPRLVGLLRRSAAGTSFEPGDSRRWWIWAFHFIPLLKEERCPDQIIPVSPERAKLGNPEATLSGGGKRENFGIHIRDSFKM